MVSFSPLVLRAPAGRPLKALRVFVRNNRGRWLPKTERTLDAFFEGFAFGQRQYPAKEARRRVSEFMLGRGPVDALIGGCEGRVCELGPEIAPDEIDGRNPAVVVWSDGPMFYLITSSSMSLADLLPIAEALYSDPNKRDRRRWRNRSRARREMGQSF
jgi:hypothetical protein